MTIWGIAGIFVLLGIIIWGGAWLFKKEVNKDDPEYILNFIKEHADKKNVALSMNYNEEKWVEVNANQPLPLASTVKIMLAIEYALQASEGRIDPKKEVTLKELDSFYVPKTDGGAHEMWIDQINKGKKVDSVPLSEVAKGMIAYSSNANTEYLMNVLGLEKVNQLPKSLGLSSHDPLYPIVSALFIPTQLMNEQGLTKAEALKKLESMDMDEYRHLATDIHQKWLNQPLNDREKKQIIKNLDMDFQKIWSDRLPRATTEDYISIMEKLNTKNYFQEEIHIYLDPIMEQLMNNPKNKEWLIHAGQKGGSTAFILTIAMYATDQENNQTEFVFFSNNLSSKEQAKLSRNINSFQLKLLQDKEFRNRIKKDLANL